MASSVNITVEDTSPLISYQPASAWRESPADDPLALQSSASSFRTTSQPGATASLSFSGTGISIFGSTGPNHGQYSVSIDGGAQQVLSGSTATVVAQVPLFSASGLTSGDHTIVITNNGVNGQTGVFDIDFMAFEAALSPPVIIDDAAAGSGLSFIPEEDASWGLNNQPSFLDGTSHATLTPNARLVFNFNGAGVALYGSVSGAHSPYSITIDGKRSSFTPSATGSHSQALLFFGSNLTPGPHQVIMSNDALDGTQYMDFDFAQVYQAAVTNELPAPTPAAGVSVESNGSEGSDVNRAESNGSEDGVTTGVVNSGSRLSPVVIAGITFGALLGLCILVAGFVMLLKLRKRSSSSPSFNYPFGGMGGLGDRFKKAPAAERGDLPVAPAPAAQFYDDSTLTEKEKIPATQGRPNIPKIITDFSAPAPVPPVAKQQPVAAAISAKPSNVEVLMTHMRSPSASSAGSVAKPAVLLKSPPAHARTGSKSQIPARGPPVIISLAAAARNPAIMQTTSSDKPEAGKQVPRKAVPAMASTTPVVAPQRPPVRPPFIALEPDVQGPERPSRPQTQLMLSPAVPVATRTFGEGRSEGGRI
ncbi:hypothetical protein BKA62DRAFT_682083 [Auriculariales sp. MPI-PUGE-AT-0066]|nr:hypothetical protein BKA62DRAFT_682083 [Auriculariales sp. MPI-PUGE-AT-0066]